LVVYAVYAAMRFDCILKSMPKANPKSIQELEAQKKAIKEAAAAEIEAIRKATAAKVAALKSSERRLRALDIREQKRLEEFYSDSPDRLKAALYGLSLVVKKPCSDQEQD
jgi:Skp family chaperone for outer membrane proteins